VSGSSLGEPELRDRLLAPCAELDPSGEVIGAHVGAVVRRLLLFERYIIESEGLREIPFLLEAFGEDGFSRLIESGAIRIAADQWWIGQIGQSDIMKPGTNSRAALPLNCFAFKTVAFLKEGYFDTTKHPGTIDVFKAAREYYFDELRPAFSPGKASQPVREAIADALIERPLAGLGESVLEAMQVDLLGHNALIRHATALESSKQLGSSVRADDLDVVVEQTNEQTYTTGSNLGRSFGLAPEAEHDVLQKALLAVSNLNKRLDDMNVYRAVNGVLAEECPMMQEKLSLLSRVIRGLNPGAQEERFNRVVEIAGLPDIEAASERPIDVDALLELRNSAECREFRAWLRKVDEADDSEIKARMSSFSEHARRFFASGRIRIARFLVTIGVGTINPPAGVFASALDQFLIDKVVGRPGPASFLSKSYRSLFKLRE
jgi:hypothetical protein